MQTSETPPAGYDLHLHTCWSYDATTPVAAYFRWAAENGTRCLAITDHHVLDSLDDVVKAAHAHPEIVTIPSAELTVTTSIGDVDLLCYGFPLDLPDELRSILTLYHEWQRATGTAISRGMQALGFDFPDARRKELLQSYRPPRTLAVQGNTHVKNGRLKAYFIERGFIAREEAYRPFMAQLRKEADFPHYPHVEQVVPVVKQLGALVAIAHPHAYATHGNTERMDALRAECRLDGIECAHRTMPKEFPPHYRQYCRQHGLFSTAGSDCHSAEEMPAQFARHGGPDDWLDEFMERIGHRAIR